MRIEIEVIDGMTVVELQNYLRQLEKLPRYNDLTIHVELDHNLGETKLVIT